MRPGCLHRAGTLALALAGWLCAPMPLRAGTSSPPAAVVLADAAADAAREAARANRHADAIEAYRQAIAAAPERRREWLLAYADQHTWSGRLDAAIALYREAIASLDAAGQLRARIGLARALSWAGRHGPALAEYEQALLQAPADREARIGQARVLSWRGRHREAAARAQQVLLDHPHDREAAAVLAESWHWMGRPDRAIRSLQAQRAADPGDERAAALLQDIQRWQRPETSIDWRDFDQSDGLAIDEWSFATRWPLADGRGAIGARYALATYRPQAGPVSSIRVQRPGVEARWRISDALQWQGGVYVDVIDTRGAAGDHRRLTHDTYVTLWPTDGLRFDLGSSRFTFDSEQTLRSGLTASELKASVDVLPDDRSQLSARISQTDYADGNRREWGQLQAQRRVLQGPRLDVGWRYTAFGFSTPGQPGYYNPDRYRSSVLTLQAQGWFGPGFNWTLRSALGREREHRAGKRSIRSGSATLSWELQAGLVVEADYSHSTSRTLPTGGFARGIGRLSLRYRH